MTGILDIVERIEACNSEENFIFFKGLAEKTEKVRGYRKPLLHIYQERIGGKDYSGAEANYGAAKMLQALEAYPEEHVDLYLISVIDGKLVMFTDTAFSKIIGVAIIE